MTALQHPAVILDVLEEHFEELDFLWEQRETSLFAHDLKLRDLEEIEERAEAHRDGLRHGGPFAIELARAAFLDGGASGAAAATFVLRDRSTPDLGAEVLDALRGDSAEARDGVRVGLRHAGSIALAPRLASISGDGPIDARIAAVDLLAFHRASPPAGMLALLGACPPELAPLLYGAIGRFGGPWSVDLLDRALAGDAPRARRAALEASARMGLPGIADRCRRAAAGTAARNPEAIAFLGVVGALEDHGILAKAAGAREGAVAAIEALGALGNVAAIPLLIEAMNDEGLRFAAGRAFGRITGADDIGSAEPPLPPPADEESEDESDLAEPEPPPDPQRAGEWWARERGRFDATVRWQSGIAVPAGPSDAVLRDLPLDARRDAWLGWRASAPDRVRDLELEATVKRQRSEGAA